MTERRAAPRSVAAPAFARYRAPIALAVAALVLLGIFAFARLPVDFLPSPEVPRLRVQVPVPGLTPETIADKVMRPLEAALLDTPGVATVESVATPGNVAADLYLRHYRDADAVQQEVSARLEHLRTILPAAVAPPVLSRLDAARAAAELTVTARGGDPLALRDWVDGELAKRLRELPGAATVQAQGGAAREIVVRPDQRRLAGFGIGFDEVIQALRNEREPQARISAPPMKRRHGREVMQSGNVAAVAAMPVTLPNGESIPLSEVADVTLGEAAGAEHASADGAAVMTVTVQAQARAARAEVADRVRAEIDWMRANRLIPAGIEVHFATRQLEQAGRVEKRLVAALIGGFLLALLVVYLLSGSGRRARILGAIMAASIGSACVGMLLMKLTLNAMTLGALALACGLLAACAILMFERARPAEPAAGFASPVVTALILPVALASLAFGGGEVEALFRGFIPVFSGAWMVSALLAWIVVPAFDTARRRTRPWTRVSRRALQRTRRLYGRLLGVLWRRPWLPPLVALAFVGATAFLFLARHPQTLPAFNPAPGATLSWRLRGPDSARLALLGDDLARRLRALPALRDVVNSARLTQAEYVLHLDEARAAELGLDITNVGRDLAIALAGVAAGSIRDADRRYDIRMQLPPRESADAIARGRLLLLGELKDRPAVYLRDVATVERGTVPAQIRHENGLPQIRVTAVVAAQATPRRAAAEIRRSLREYTLPAGYALSGDGVGESAARAARDMRLPVLALCFVLAALLLWRRSWRVVLPVMACAVIVATAVTALLIRLPLPFSVWFGAVVAVGIAAFHAAAFVLPIEAMHHAGALSRRTLRQAARDRWHPALTMTLAAIAGMAPLMAFGGVTDALRPLIAVVAASLILAFLASVLFIPSLYFLLTRREQTPGQPHL
jgi:multidrug efflux pump subunit AcrB